MIKKIWLLPLPLLIAACSSLQHKPIQPFPVTQPSAGHAVIFADVLINHQPCSLLDLTIRTTKDKPVASINAYRGTNYGRLGLKEFAIVPAGTYKITRVKCGQVFVTTHTHETWLKKKTGMDVLRSIIGSPRFTVKAGEIRHIGAINIKTVQKSGLFQQAKAIMEPLPAKQQHKALLKKHYPNIYGKMVFKPAISIAVMARAMKKSKQLKQKKKPSNQ